MRGSSLASVASGLRIGTIDKPNFVELVGQRNVTHHFACVIACRVIVERDGGLRFANPPYRLTDPRNPFSNRLISRSRFSRDSRLIQNRPFN